jgi:hypothetical protein
MDGGHRLDEGAGSPPTLEVTSGLSLLTFDSEGNVTGLTTGVQVTDMCQVLA